MKVAGFFKFVFIVVVVVVVVVFYAMSMCPQRFLLARDFCLVGGSQSGDCGCRLGYIRAMRTR